jgi:uncharacterized membrane protein (Fun14 family)
MVQLDPQLLGLQLGGSAAIGGLIGYFAKKVAKLIALIIGSELVLFKFLESQGLMIVRWDKLTAGIVQAGRDGTSVAQGLLETFIATAGVGASFAGGFYLGFRRA